MCFCELIKLKLFGSETQMYLLTIPKCTVLYTSRNESIGVVHFISVKSKYMSALNCARADFLIYSYIHYVLFSDIKRKQNMYKQVSLAHLCISAK